MLKRESILLILVACVSLTGGYSLYQFIDNEPDAATTSAKETVLSAIPFNDLQGNESVLGDWKQPVILVNFWAPWCAPCRREIPALVKIQQEYADRVLIVGLALDSIENVENFAADYKMNYPSYIAGANIPMYNAAFGNKSGSLPHTAIINQKRQLFFTHTGELTAPELRKEIDRLLAEI